MRKALVAALCAAAIMASVVSAAQASTHFADGKSTIGVTVNLDNWVYIQLADISVNFTTESTSLQTSPWFNQGNPAAGAPNNFKLWTNTPVDITFTSGGFSNAGYNSLVSYELYETGFGATPIGTLAPGAANSMYISANGVYDGSLLVKFTAPTDKAAMAALGQTATDVVTVTVTPRD
jgi:hypothetical protein